MGLSLELSIVQWLLISVSALLVGMSKAGVPGVSMIAIPTLAIIFGGKDSTGVLLPMLIMADVFGVAYYHRHANWRHITKALPWAVIGVLLALYVGSKVNDQVFRQLIAAVIFVSIALMLWRDRKKETINNIPNTWHFAALMGLAGGFATMIGNAAGPIFAIYLLALRLPKNEYIGTAAWFFFIINVFKFPLHVFVWKTIDVSSLTINLVTLPAIGAGAFLGFYLIKKISDQRYRWLVILVTILSAFLMLI